MPAVTSSTVEEQNEADQKMWSALKRYIIRERQRKKEGNSLIWKLTKVYSYLHLMQLNS